MVGLLTSVVPSKKIMVTSGGLGTVSLFWPIETKALGEDA